jgi:DNA-binding NarL/FixJ family response regulator
VVALVTEGLRNADIARRLFVSPTTVDHHVSAILTKLGVRTRGRGGPSPEAIRRAAEVNQLPVDRITEVRFLDPYFYR